MPGPDQLVILLGVAVAGVLILLLVGRMTRSSSPSGEHPQTGAATLPGAARPAPSVSSTVSAPTPAPSGGQGDHDLPGEWGGNAAPSPAVTSAAPAPAIEGELPDPSSPAVPTLDRRPERPPALPTRPARADLQAELHSKDLELGRLEAQALGTLESTIEWFDSQVDLLKAELRRAQRNERLLAARVDEEAQRARELAATVAKRDARVADLLAELETQRA